MLIQSDIVREMETLAPMLVDRENEMSRIITAMDNAARGEGKFICLKGEAGSGKTRLAEETAHEAMQRGYLVGFSTSIISSVVPYHAWTEVLEEFELSHLKEETAPPKLLGLYCISSDGEVAGKIERKGENLSQEAQPVLLELARPSDNGSERFVEDGGLTTLTKGEFRLIVWRGEGFHLGAILEGREDEIFLSDLGELADAIQSISADTSVSRDDFRAIVEAPMAQLFDSEKYEGIDYAKENPELRQSRLFENVVLGIDRKAGTHSACMIFDDLQWADPSSLELLHYVIRNTQKANILFLGTHRVEAERVRPYLQDWLQKMMKENLVSEMDIKGLSREYMADLAHSFQGPHDLPDDFLDFLWQETQGYPLFIREVLQGLVEDGAIQTRGTCKSLIRPLTELALPEMIDKVIQDRLDRLPRSERLLLEAAATCGARFTATLVAKAVGEDEEKVVDGLNTITSLYGLLRPAGDGFAFDHPSVHEAVYGQIPPESKRGYHRQAAEWLEMTGGPIEETAEHYYSCGNDEKALRYLIKSAEKAKSSYSNEEAIRFYSQALEFGQDERERLRVYEKMGDICRTIGEYDRAIEFFNKALELATRKDTKARIMSQIGGAQHSQGKYEAAFRTCEKALAVVGGSSSKEEATALSNIGNANLWLDNHKEAIANLKKCLEILENIGDDYTMAGALNNIGIVYSNKGEYDTALQYLNRCLEISKQVGRLDSMAFSLNNIGNINRYRGNYDKALENFEESLRLKEKMGHQKGIASSIANIGSVHENQGRYEEALECYKRSARISKRIGDPKELSLIYGDMAHVYCCKKEFDEALEHCNRGLALAQKMGIRTWEAVPRRVYGMVYREQKKWNESIENLERSAELCKEGGMMLDLGEAYAETGLTWKSMGETEKAKEMLDKALRILEDIKAEDLAKQVRDALREV